MYVVDLDELKKVGAFERDTVSHGMMFEDNRDQTMVVKHGSRSYGNLIYGNIRVFQDRVGPYGPPDVTLLRNDGTKKDLRAIFSRKYSESAW